MNKKVLTDAHDRNYWRKKRLKAYKIFGKEFRKTLLKTEDNTPKPPRGRGDARSVWLTKALTESLIGRYGEGFGDYM